MQKSFQVQKLLLVQNFFQVQKFFHMQIFFQVQKFFSAKNFSIANNFSSAKIFLCVKFLFMCKTFCKYMVTFIQGLESTSISDENAKNPFGPSCPLSPCTYLEPILYLSCAHLVPTLISIKVTVCNY